MSCIRKKYMRFTLCGGILHFIMGIGALGMRIGLYTDNANTAETTETNRPQPNIGILIFGPLYLGLGVTSLIGTLIGKECIGRRTSKSGKNLEAAAAIHDTNPPTVIPNKKEEMQPTSPPAPMTILEKSESQLLRETDIKLERIQKEVKILVLQKEMEIIKSLEVAPVYIPYTSSQCMPYQSYDGSVPYAPELVHPYYGQPVAHSSVPSHSNKLTMIFLVYKLYIV